MLRIYLLVSECLEKGNNKITRAVDSQRCCTSTLEALSLFPCHFKLCFNVHMIGCHVELFSRILQMVQISRE